MTAPLLLPPDDPEVQRALAALPANEREVVAEFVALEVERDPTLGIEPMFTSLWLRAANMAREEAARDARVVAPGAAAEAAILLKPNGGDVITQVELLTTSALLALKLPDVSWRIEGLLPDGALGILSGWSGTWKTWGLHHVAVELARGGRFMDAYRCQQGPVLFVQAEENLTEHRRKHSWTVSGAGLSENEILGLDVYHLVGPVLLTDREALAALVGRVRAIKPAVVLIDSLRQTFAGDENSSEFAQTIKVAFSEIQAAHACTVLLVHHTRKTAKESGLNEPGQRLRGSGALRAILDTHLAIDRDPAGFGTLIHEKSRMGRELPPFNFQFDATEGRAWFENLGPAADPTAGTGAAKCIVDLLRDAPARTMCRQEILAALSASFNEDQVDRALKKLVQKKRLAKGERAKGTPYTLCEQVGE